MTTEAYESEGEKLAIVRAPAAQRLQGDTAGSWPAPRRTLADVLAALQELGERTQAIFYLRRLENLKIREIAVI